MNADDLAMLVLSALGFNELLDLCRKITSDNLINFSTRKKLVLLFQPRKCRILTKPKIFLGFTVLSYVREFKYLGHIFMDDSEIES